MTENLNGKVIWVMAKGYTPDEGGMQTYARSVAESYAALGARVIVFTQTSVGPRDAEVGPVRVVDIGPDTSPNVLPKFLRAMRFVLKHKGKPDFVHGTTWRTSVPAMLLGLPYVTTFHGREFMYPRGLALMVMRRVAKKAQRVIAVSHYSAEKLSQRLNGAIQPVVAWNGITKGLSERRETPGRERIPLILSLCRLEPRKNIAAAIEAAAVCHDRDLAFHFVICGRGPEEEALAALVKRHRLEQRVTMAGFVDQSRAEQLYRDADIFIHPQITTDGGRDFEGFGIAIADAMLSGCAVIVGKDGGSAELIRNEESGLVVDGDSPAEVSQALAHLLFDADLRERLGKIGAMRASTLFRWDRHVQIVLGNQAGDDI